MGRRGEGYGSEDHLRRYLTEQPKALNEAVAGVPGVRGLSVSWLDFPLHADGREREFRGIEFLRDEASYRRVVAEWRNFWPQRGQPQNWDAVGRVGNEWLLIEAKANHPEFCSPPTTAKREGGLGQ